jgi:transposase
MSKKAFSQAQIAHCVSAKLNGHDAWAYLKDILTKLPTWPNSRLQELLPHRWVVSTATH